MPAPTKQADAFNIVTIAQAGRLQYEAVLLAASLRQSNPDFAGRLFIAQPNPGPLWPNDPGIDDPAVLQALHDLGAEVIGFDNQVFGQSYPYGNKAEALSALPKGQPFLFLDTDTLITGPISALPIATAPPAASMRRTDTWPTIELYGPGYAETWKSLYDKFGLDFDSSLDPDQPDEYWQRYLYFNAGWFFGPCPVAFGDRLVETMRAIRDDPTPQIVCQSMDPWLDQIALPLVIHGFGGGRPGPDLVGLDGDITCHYRALPLLYARENDHVVEVLEAVTAPNKIKKVLKAYDPFKRMIFQGRGQKVRALFDRNNLPRRERAIRNRIKREGFWMR